MDGNLVNLLINNGPTGILAAVLLWLHKDNIKEFRDQIQETIKAFREEQRAEREHRETTLNAYRQDAVAAQTRFNERLQEISNDIEKIVGRVEQLHDSRPKKPGRPHP